MALRAPPSGIAFVLPFVYNLLRRHPNCMPMIHRVDCTGNDIFVFEETDPAKSKAIDSSLWELDILTKHYCPSVARYVIFIYVFKKLMLLF